MNQGQKLKELASKNETNDAVVHALGARMRMREFIDIRNLRYALKREGFKIVDSDFSNLWKEWEKMGIGSVAKGRVSNEDRFVPNYDMRKVAEASLKGTDLSIDDKKPITGVVLAKRTTKTILKKKHPEKKYPKTSVSVTIKTSTGKTIELNQADINELRDTLNHIS